MNRTMYRVGDKLCPYCISEGPFVSIGLSHEINSGHKWTYLECLECGNTFIKHANYKLNETNQDISTVKAGLYLG